MKLKHFQIQNFKSIQDSGVCYLPSPDNITILAGQNESGKSSILQALHSFETGIIMPESIQMGKFPSIHCQFLTENSSLFEIISNKMELPEAARNYFDGITEFCISRVFDDANSSNLISDSIFSNSFDELIKNHNDSIEGESKEMAAYHEALKERIKLNAELNTVKSRVPVKELDIAKINLQLSKIEDKVAKYETLDSIIKSKLLKDFYDEHEAHQNELSTEKRILDEEVKVLKKKITDDDFDDDEDEEVIEAQVDIKLNKNKALIDDIATLTAEFGDILEDFKKNIGIKSIITEADLAKIKSEASGLIFNYLPLFVFFDDFCDLLPDKVLISDLVSKNKTIQGYQAVKNMETILNANFEDLDKHDDNLREMHQEDYKETITANFNEKWKQKISEGNGANIHIKYNQGRGAKAAYLNFYINTKKGEYLTPAQRSQGFKWFLSFFLHLKAEDHRRGGSLLILFDEPGLYLHSKAQNDMLQVFEELAEKNQIIYSTHSPYLIDSKKLHRVRLIINSKDHGTTIEKITTAKLKNQPNAIKPIADAIGLDVASSFSVVNKKNVLLEGLSDFHYFTAMKLLLYPKDDFCFIPSMGSSNIHLLMELCIGWGLEWLILFDKSGVEEDYKKIKRNFFNDDESAIKERILIMKADGIEDLFNQEDLKLVNPLYVMNGNNSSSVKSFGGKELFGRLFLDKVISGEIKKNSISEVGLANFTEIFSFIKKQFR